VLEYCYLRKEGHAAAQAPPAVPCPSASKAVKKLSPQQLQALQALLDQLIRQASPEPYAFASQWLAKMNVKRSLSTKPGLDLPPRVRQVRQEGLLLR
jgi:uncharacterized protein (DUF924 family)